MPTEVIDNFTGRLTRRSTGTLNSGFAKYATSFGYDPFSDPGNLTWLEQPIAIAGLPGGATVIAAKVRLESGTTYVYTLQNSGALYKIQVNDTATKNPNYDTPVLLTTIATNNLWNNGDWGTSLQFYGSTLKIFIGSPKGVTSVNFDGTGEAFIGLLASYTSSVPRPCAQFLGKLYFGNGSNIIEIDSTETVTSYAKLSPGFPTGTFVRDLDVSPDGNYLQITVSTINAPLNGSINQETSSLASTDSYKFYWNGTDTGYTAFDSYSGYSFTSNTAFGQNNYTLGYDLGGTAIYSGSQKQISLPNLISPTFGAVFSTGNILGFASPEYVQSSANLDGSIFLYGQYDEEVPKGLFRFLRLAPTSGTDIISMPVCLTVSNLFYGSALAAYPGNVVGSAKLYLSAYETDASFQYSKFYTFTTVPTGLGTAIGGVWESQQQLLGKKAKPTNVRFYMEPLVANNSFKIDLIDSGGNVISGGSQTFTVGSGDVVAGQDFVWYTPQTASLYSVGVRITNLGSVNWTGEKLELDWSPQGK